MHSHDKLIIAEISGNFKSKVLRRFIFSVVIILWDETNGCIILERRYVYQANMILYNTNGGRDMELLGNKIRMLRVNKNITQAELAQELSVSSQAVSKWERSIASPDISALPAIARFFGITMDELFNYRLDALTYKERFVRFLWDNDVLKFGQFQLKSGRVTPYFINTERFSSGSQLAKIGEFYAECIWENNLHTDLLLANTDKESHIVTAVSMTLYRKYGFDVNCWINNTIGKLSGPHENVTLLKDTMASGDTLRTVMGDIRQTVGAYPSSIVLAVDRLERGLHSDWTTSNEIRKEFGVQIFSIVTVDDIINALENRVIPGTEHLEAMKAYRKQYRGN